MSVKPFIKPQPVGKTTQKYTPRIDVDVEDEKPKRKTFSAAFWLSWPELVKSIESQFKKWPKLLVIWAIIKQEVENKQ